MTLVNLDQLSALRTAEGERALAAADELSAHDPLAAASILRGQGFPATLATAALGQAQLRRSGRAKFGEDSARMFFTRAGLEQATRGAVAARRAARLVECGATSVADLGCGMGADTIAFARAGLRVRGVDADPVTAGVAAANAAALGLDDLVEIRCADVSAVELSTVDAVFCDPARRSATTGRRVSRPDAYSPPWAFVAALARPANGTRLGVAVLKLAPGVDHALIPAGAEAQWVSVDGDVVEAAFWCGRPARTPRRATLLRSTGTACEVAGELVGSGTAVAPVGRLRRYLHDPDGAVVRATLVAEFASTVDGVLADQTIAYVYTDAPAATPYARCYEVLDAMPFSLKRLRAVLRDRGVGRLTVKKRGSALDPEQLRRDLRLAGHESAVVVLTRVHGAPTVLICQAVAG